MHRTPKLKDQARLLREAYQEKGLTLSSGESLELVAKLNGYASWNAASADQKKYTAGNTRMTVNIVSWTVIHHHNHGEDVFTVYTDNRPDDDEAVEVINSEGGGYDACMGEWFEVLGPEVKTLTLQLDELEAKVVPPALFEDRVVRVFEVDMTDAFDYTVPEEIPEWKWIQSNGSFAHRGNNKEPGVWEFMVYTETALESEDCPEALTKFFEQAKKTNCPWVMFHQG